MKLFSWSPGRSALLTLGAVLLVAGVACTTGGSDSAVTAATTAPTIAATAAAPQDVAINTDAAKNSNAILADDAMKDGDKMDKDDDDGMGDVTTFSIVIENIGKVYDFNASGVGGDGPIGPGGSFTFEFDAAPGSVLSFATMFVASNDFFFAPSEAGIALYDGTGTPISGDVTEMVMLWDAGTEADQEPGAGSEQPLMSSGNPVGPPDTDTTVRPASDDFGNLPAVGDVIRVSVNNLSGTRFEVVIENVSTASTLVTAAGGSSAVPLAPPVWVVHTAPGSLFTAGQPDRGEGLEALAETGSPVALAVDIDMRTGLTSPLAPGVFALHTEDEILFENGDEDRGEGLEALAEDGSPGELASSLATDDEVIKSGVFAVPVGGSGPAPAFPGDSYLFEIKAVPSDFLSLATMLVQTNDLFYAPSEDGLALFDPSGDPISGDVTSQFLLWDAGTEVNQAPGIGPDQAPRQSGPNTGETESGDVRPVSDGFVYPDVDAIIRVTITPQG